MTSAELAGSPVSTRRYNSTTRPFAILQTKLAMPHLQCRSIAKEGGKSKRLLKQEVYGG